MKYYWTRYLLRYPLALVYMLQDTEYRFDRYSAWLWRTSDFRAVMRRRQLDMTRKVTLLVVSLRLIGIAAVIAIVISFYLWTSSDNFWWLILAIAVIVFAPFIMAYGILLPLIGGSLLIQKPRERRMMARAQHILHDHPASRIAVVGSYGKTTAKEMLATVLAEGLDVAATPGNMNTAIGISRFATTLTGREQLLIVELGEEKVGDIEKLARLLRPDTAIVTGINEAHLASFKTLDRTVETIFEIENFVEPQNLYVNAENELVAKHTSKGLAFSRNGIGDWKVSDASTSLDGTEFTLANGKKTLHIQTGLLGLHTIGVTTAVAAIAESKGLTTSQIEAGFRKVHAFEHRMQLRPLHGAWIIDDTYNGNSDGVEAGLAFLRDMKATRRIFVTPGLVEQGNQTEVVHNHIGEWAAVSADVVILMRNSVTTFIEAGLDAKNFKGELIVIDDPLEFYSNLDQFVAAGDVVLMQNDWTDNYA